MHADPVCLRLVVPWFLGGVLIAAALVLARPVATFAAPPQGGKGGSSRLALTTQPAGATIFVDGHPSGKTPGEVDGLGPGRYFVRLELEGYRPAELVVELSAGQRFQPALIELISNSAPHPPVAVAPPPPPPLKVVATPAPVRATPPPAATPAPAAAAPAAPADEEQSIRSLVNSYLQSIAASDISAYLRLCAPKVDYYDEGMQSHDGIRKIRQKQKDRWPAYEIANVREVSIRTTDKPGVRRASVTYDWSVSNSATGRKASGTASDLIDIRQTGGQWLIVKTRQNVDRKNRN